MQQQTAVIAATADAMPSHHTARTRGQKRQPAWLACAAQLLLLYKAAAASISCCPTGSSAQVCRHHSTWHAGNSTTRVQHSTSKP